jgi:hypothetical protein
MITLFGIVNTVTANIYASGSANAGSAAQMANTSLNFEFTMMYQI